MVMLAYDLAGGQDLDEIMPFAMSNEFIHTASLVHDDINDEAALTEGVRTQFMQNMVRLKLIIAGDWLFSRFWIGGQIRKIRSRCNGSLLFKIS